MDIENKTLNTILNALCSENQLLNWNIHQQKCGSVMVKIRFTNNMEYDQNKQVGSSEDAL